LNQRTAKREERHRKLLKATRSRRNGRNLYDCEDRGLLLAQCAYEAVSAVFSWLSISEIRKPPRAYKDAQFARQLAVRIMAVDLNVARRKVTRMQGRQRRSIHLAVQAVEKRMANPVFFEAYVRMAATAKAFYAERTDRHGAKFAL
jgi:hypothetical protein